MKQFVTSVSILSLLAVLFSCGGSGENTVTLNEGSLSMDLSIPDALRGPSISELQVQLSVDGANPVDLLVDEASNSISGTVTGVAAGNHVLRFMYVITIGGFDVTLATVIKNITVVSGQTVDILIADIDLNRNFDDDGDGFTNLAEVNIGTSSNDSSDTPSASPQFSVADASLGSTSTSSGVSETARVGESAVGKTTSTNYQVTVGFSSN